MTALRKKAIAMVESIAEDKLPVIIHAIKELESDDEERKKKDEAYLSLKRMIRPIPGLDEEKVLAEYREERYGL